MRRPLLADGFRGMSLLLSESKSMAVTAELSPIVAVNPFVDIFPPKC
jgi:hypothetical protein